MPKIRLDEGEDPGVQQYIIPDDEGFTVQTKFLDTQNVLDENQAKRSFDPKPRAVTKGGNALRHVGSIPMHVMHSWIKENGGRWPDHEFILKKLKDPDFSKLLMTEEKF